jgi:hypothetical protein
MEYEEAAGRWAAERIGISPTSVDWSAPCRVEWFYNSGWGGTDVTPGDPAYSGIRFTYTDTAGHKRDRELGTDMQGSGMYSEGTWDLVSILREILHISSAPPAPASPS